jgi:hypothetical protein
MKRSEGLDSKGKFDLSNSILKLNVCGVSIFFLLKRNIIWEAGLKVYKGFAEISV